MANFIFSFILPTYNEKENIKILIPQIITEFRDFSLEIIVIDDGSTDGTKEAINNLQTKLSFVKLIQRNSLQGIGSALKEGYNQATGEYIISCDADLSFSVQELKKIGNVFLTDQVDLVIGSRHLAKSYYEAKSFNILKKKIISSVGNRFVRLLTGLPFHDYSANCRGIKKSSWQELKIVDNSNFMLFEMIAQAYQKGFKIVEVPVSFFDRKFGHSKLKLEKEVLKSFIKFIKAKYLWFHLRRQRKLIHQQKDVNNQD